MYNVSDKFKEHVKNNGYIEKRAKSAKEPVAKLKWSDFELEPLKPNLIKNGWDDFEAYGGAEVEITPVGNGLTRIQTRGGSSGVKLLYNYGLFTNPNTFSFYIKNIGKNTVRVRHNQPWLWEDVLHQTDAFIDIRSNGHDTRPVLLSVLSVDENDTLDFIASEPTLVEGNELNPVLIVDDLGNGKSKVSVFGANENTKLVHRGTKGIKGEPYTVKTNIDNKGNQLQLDTNLDEQSETIKKGNNDVKLEGKLKDNNIEIKLGRG